MAIYVRKQHNRLHWPEDHTMYTLYHSIYYGFWLRLKKHGFTVLCSFSNTRQSGNVTYLQTCWCFYNKKTKVQVMLMASRNLFIMRIFEDNKKVLKVEKVCYSHLEAPFLKYFGQNDKPLFIRRLGVQNNIVMKFLQKWQQHVNKGGKYKDMILRLGVLPPYLPKALSTPMKRGK